MDNSCLQVEIKGKKSIPQMWLCLSKGMHGMYFVQCLTLSISIPPLLSKYLPHFFSHWCVFASICANFFTSSGFHVFRLNNPEPNHSCWCGSIYSFHCHMNGFSSRHIAIQRCSFFSLGIRVLTFSFDCSAFIIHIECEFVCVCVQFASDFHKSRRVFT